VTNPELTFEFALAERLGMTVAEMRKRVSTNEFAQWVALEELREYERQKARKKAAARRR